jgi:hypothetical protein
MIVASINGTPGLGFAESIQHRDGTTDRTGVIKMTAANAQRLQTILERSEPLVYTGPVYCDGRWCSQTFSIVARNVVIAPGEPAIVHMAEKKAEESAAA